jgi:hypothetical protein
MIHNEDKNSEGTRVYKKPYMAKIKTNRNTEGISKHKRTKQGGRVVKTSSMNKNQKANYKKYRGQGR